ncbi:MAG TPA: hypothetical protein VFK47_06045 [Ktedonobacteraceae bacterium]|nr:hypothetical protein [Ktedonobacteraceae bacterium]
MFRQVDTRICEVCGKQFIMGYGYSIAASWLVTGHCAVGQYMCEQAMGGQHWGCTPEHALEALQNCLAHDEHLSTTNLRAKHEKAPKPLVAKDDEWMLEKYPNFPFIGE